MQMTKKSLLLVLTLGITLVFGLNAVLATEACTILWPSNGGFTRDGGVADSNVTIGFNVTQNNVDSILACNFTVAPHSCNTTAGITFANVTNTSADQKAFTVPLNISVFAQNTRIWLNVSSFNQSNQYGAANVSDTGCSSSFIIDRTAPSVSIVRPLNENDVLGIAPAKFQYSVGDTIDGTVNNRIHNCSLFLNAVSDQVDTVVENTSNTFDKTFSGSTTGLWKVECMDEAGNHGNSTTADYKAQIPGKVIPGFKERISWLPTITFPWSDIGFWNWFKEKLIFWR